ncbi:protein CURLY FLAG LEAF 1-like [Phragmites australis]|uniref:protein CURLY FLAG LEAF 1-like n=1 Tax=Phragmites australis TaxID=29695 RepID=UPI002D77C255|nr:protein CURLY FLAG LEAF 1-like [Phragmites australis]
MTTAPNIEMIASSLRHCSLNGGGGGRRRGGSGRRRSEGGDDSEGVTVELNSDVALPYHWEQCLDLRTGQVYYINWEDGTRTTVDPRTSAFSLAPTPRFTSSASRRSRRDSTPSSGYTSVSSVDVAEWPHAGAAADIDSGYDNDNEDDDGDEEEDEAESSSTTSSSSSSTGSSRGSAVSSMLSSFSPTDESASGDNGRAFRTVDNNSAGHVLVAAGCRACFMYFMVPKLADVCPKCGSSGLLHLSRNGYA